MDSAPKRVHRRIRIVKHDKYIHIFSYRATFFSFYASFFRFRNQLGRIFFLGSRKRYALRAAIYSFLSSRARSSWASDFLILSLVSFFIFVCFWFRKGTKNPGTSRPGATKNTYT